MKSIGINEEMHQRLKILAIASNKKIYELVLEAIELLESKYNNERQNIRSNITPRE
jgi:hypothetical protein